MDNIFTKAFGRLVPKHSINLQSQDTTFMKVVGSFFSYLTGNSNFSEYVKAYGDNPLVYMIIKKISFTSASIARIAVDGSGEVIENSVLLEILKNPNKDQGQIEFLETINEYLNTTGNTYVRYIKGIGMGQELEVLATQNVQIKCNDFGMVTGYTYKKPKTNTYVTYPVEEILHIKTSNIVNIDQDNYKYGLSPLEAAWIIINSSGEKFKAEASIFKNRGIIGILTNKSDTPMLPTERKRMQSEFNDDIGGASKYNQIKISNTDLAFVQTGMSPTDLKLLEGILSSLRQLCSIFGMPSILFNDNEKSTFNNFEQAVKLAYNDVYIPLANKVDKELSSFLNEQLGTNELIKVDLTSIEVVKSSTNEVAQALNNMSPLLANKVLEQLTVNEIRELAGLDTVEGGDVVATTQQSDPNINVSA